MIASVPRDLTRSMLLERMSRMVDETDIASHTLALLRKIDEHTERMAEDLTSSCACPA